MVMFLLPLRTPFAQETPKKPVPIIFDTDMAEDYEDVGADAVLHALADSGYAKILATVADTKYEGVAAVLDVINTYFKEPDIPIGVPKGDAPDEKGWPRPWAVTLISKYPHKIKHNSEVPGAVEVYRRVLAVQPDKSVTIETEGFLTNVADLLKSKPDQYSPLSGKELVKKKVKLLVSMAGKFPSGKEYNVFTDPVSAKLVYENWPTPVVFDGFEIGEKIRAGVSLIEDDKIVNSPIRDVYRIGLPSTQEEQIGRMSWDEIAVLVAVKGYKPLFNLRGGRIIIHDDGSNEWDYKGHGQFYLTPRAPAEEVGKIIDKLEMCQPR